MILTNSSKRNLMYNYNATWKIPNFFDAESNKLGNSFVVFSSTLE